VTIQTASKVQAKGTDASTPIPELWHSQPVTQYTEGSYGHSLYVGDFFVKGSKLYQRIDNGFNIYDESTGALLSTVNVPSGLYVSFTQAYNNYLYSYVENDTINVYNINTNPASLVRSVKGFEFTVADNILIVMDTWGVPASQNIAAYDATTGKQLWVKYLQCDAWSATVAFGLVYLNCSDSSAVPTLHAIYVKDGSIAWKQATSMSLYLHVVVGNILYTQDELGYEQPRLVAYNATDGTLLWTKSYPYPTRFSYIVAGNRGVFTYTTNISNLPYTSTVASFNSNGMIVWQQSFPNIYSGTDSLTYANGVVYAGITKVVKAFDENTGAPVGTTNTLGDNVSTREIAADNNVLFVNVTDETKYPVSNTETVYAYGQRPPTVTNASFTGTEGQPGTGIVQAQSASNKKLTLTASGLPSFASFKDNGNNTGTVTFTPKAGNAGTYTFTVTASDGSQTGTGTVTLKITKASSSKNKLVVIVQGIGSSLSKGNVAGNNGYGDVPEPDFGTIVPKLKATAEFKTNTQFMAFSYGGTQNHTDGKPSIYGCEATYANPIMLEESYLKAQISLYLTKHPNTDVYIFSHSLGGVVTFAYIADLVENNLHSLSLGGGSVLKAVAIGDSPLGGIIADTSYLKLMIGNAIHCALPNNVFSIADLIRIKAQIPSKTFFEGLTASIYYSILNNGKGKYITNQVVAQNAINLGLRLVIVGNDYDLLWHPNVCGQGSNFGNTEYMVETGTGKNGGVLYVRSFKSGSLSPLECVKLPSTLGYHFAVLSNNDVETVVWEVFTDRKVDKLTPVTLSHKP